MMKENIMKSRIPINTKIEGALISRPGIKSLIPVGTWWEIEHYRKGNLIDKWEQKNVTTDEGLNFMLNVMFHGTSAYSPWYMGIFNTDTTPAVGTTYATPVFTESSDYTSANRPEYVEAAASGKVITNTANKATFTMNATTTIYGAFLCGGTSASSKGNASDGVLFAASKFTTAKSVVSSDVLMVVCSITLADA
jgi:hypothetical protein